MSHSYIIIFLRSIKALFLDQSKQTNTLTAHPALAAGPEETCVVCLEKERTHCYIPCGHICICTDCINHPGCQMQCPICKGPGTLQRIFNA